jgi:hypothetical protein
MAEAIGLDVDIGEGLISFFSGSDPVKRVRVTSVPTGARVTYGSGSRVMRTNTGIVPIPSNLMTTITVERDGFPPCFLDSAEVETAPTGHSVMHCDFRRIAELEGRQTNGRRVLEPVSAR